MSADGKPRKTFSWPTGSDELLEAARQARRDLGLADLSEAALVRWALEVASNVDEVPEPRKGTRS